MAIVENAGEDLITDEDLQGTPQEILGKLAQKVSLDLWVWQYGLLSFQAGGYKSRKIFALFIDDPIWKYPVFSQSNS